MRIHIATDHAGLEFSTRLQQHLVAQGHEVIVDITHAGVCHTDIHVREGGYDMGSLGFRRTPGTEYPLTMGHEIAGVVSAVGEGVTHVAPGDRAQHHPDQGQHGTRRPGSPARDGGDQRYCEYGYVQPL